MAAPNQPVCNVKISRSDPAAGIEPHYDVFSVPYEEGNTVMDVLNYIYENLDSTIAFRTGCAGAGYQRCGACAVAVNGRPVLCCKTLASASMTIEPHPKFEAIRDLAVNFGGVRPAKRPEKQWVRITVDPQKCDGCRDCVFVCPVGVYELKKIEDKVVSVPVDIGNCCGESCSQCSIFCKNTAIVVQDVKDREEK